MYPGVGECVPSSVEAVAKGGPSSVEAAVEAWAPLILQGASERKRERARVHSYCSQTHRSEKTHRSGSAFTLLEVRKKKSYTHIA
jgi:hypothetical protein